MTLEDIGKLPELFGFEGDILDDPRVQIPEKKQKTTKPKKDKPKNLDPENIDLDRTYNRQDTDEFPDMPDILKEWPELM